jgi:hypothetical protein
MMFLGSRWKSNTRSIGAAISMERANRGIRCTTSPGPADPTTLRSADIGARDHKQSYYTGLRIPLPGPMLAAFEGRSFDRLPAPLFALHVFVHWI